jgi:hypothetical protein
MAVVLPPDPSFGAQLELSKFARQMAGSDR